MNTVNVVDARKSFSELVARVAFGGARVVVERRGRPMAALISIADLRRLEEFERQASTARERGLAALAQARTLRQAVLAEQGGAYQPDATALLAELREERDDELSAGLR